MVSIFRPFREWRFEGTQLTVRKTGPVFMKKRVLFFCTAIFDFREDRRIYHPDGL